jgi:alkyldihydroxyacetonephosphate synthase
VASAPTRAPAPATLPPREMRWWGWGDAAHASAPPEHALGWLRERIGGVGGERRPPVALDDVRLRPAELPDGLRDRLVGLVGADGVCDDRGARVVHAAGKSYPDLVRQRSGDAEQAPDAVVLPADAAAVAGVLRACVDTGVAVVPFGGGTSVVGGVEPLRDGFGAVIALDLARLDGLHSLDERSQTAVVAAGTRGPVLEAALGRIGLTLGHFPQSFEFVTVGGCAATRSAGQASTGYGRMDDLVVGLRCVAPAGDLDLAARPPSAAGPDLRELVVGSEGTLGVLTSVALRVRPRPEVTRYEGFVLPSLAAGVEALRALAQQGLAPDVTRLSDETETEMSFALAGDGGLKGRLARGYLRFNDVEHGCLAIAGWEGDAERVRTRREEAAAVLGRSGAVALGQAPGRAWARGRFAAPYLRDDLLDRGVMVETLETAGQWSGLLDLHAAVRGALSEHAPLVACHVSHVYPTGASLYFTFLAAQQPGRELEQWREAKAAASDAIVAAGGTITHHHAVGRDHAPWMRAEVGDSGLAVLRAVKAELDPTGILNPGKLLPG